MSGIDFVVGSYQSESGDRSLNRKHTPATCPQKAVTEDDMGAYILLPPVWEN
jgi:hypothetical protein